MSASPELILIMVGMMLNFPAWKKKGHEVTIERTTHKTNSRVWCYTGEAAAAPWVCFVHGGFAVNNLGG